MPTHRMTQGDSEPTLTLQLLDGTTPVDLTSATSVEFSMANARGVRAAGRMEVADQGTQRGVVSYRWQQGDTSLTGSYTATVRVGWPGGRQQTFPAVPTLLVDVAPDAGR